MGRVGFLRGRREGISPGPSAGPRGWVAVPGSPWCGAASRQSLPLLLHSCCLCRFTRPSVCLSLCLLYLFLFLKVFFFLMWTIFKVFIKKKSLYWSCYNMASVLCFVFFFCPWDMWDVSSPTRGGTCTPCIGEGRFLTPGPQGSPFSSLFKDTSHTGEGPV